MESKSKAPQLIAATAVAFLWQVGPVAWCAFSYGHRSQRAGMSFLLLIVVPLLSGVIHRSKLVGYSAFTIGAIAILIYLGLRYFFLLLAGTHW